MGRLKMPGRSKRQPEPEPREQRAMPMPTLMTYDPYLVKLTRDLEEAKQKSKPKRTN
ncbi:MAG: hypothetical protein JW889_10555 [Verrucomicrobia bacterium]|nr:hypothetical protein [Verrucomicrobiota bacterium]